MADIDLGRVFEALNNKMDLDMANIPNNIDYVIESQLPTAENNYTWYRKYKSGWVEQGGVGISQGYNQSAQNITFIKNMKDTYYGVAVCAGASEQASWEFSVRVARKMTNGLDVRGGVNSNSSYTGEFHWQVSGMGASE